MNTATTRKGVLLDILTTGVSFEGAKCSPWMDDLFFPEKSGNGHYEAARQICGTCPVRQACLDVAMQEEGNLSAPSRYGMRGGLTPDERYKLRFPHGRRAASR